MQFVARSWFALASTVASIFGGGSPLHPTATTNTASRTITLRKCIAIMGYYNQKLGGAVWQDDSANNAANHLVPMLVFVLDAESQLLGQFSPLLS